MPKTITQMKRRLELALEQADEADAVLELVREVVARNEFRPEDVFAESELRLSLERLDGSEMPYSDGNGNTWSGRGRRPLWLTQALASGASLEDFQTEKRDRHRGALGHGKR